MKTVLVSVTDKTGLDNFLKRLERFDELKLIATTSSAKFLKEQGFACMRVEELTAFPEILSGRVKTLHPRVFAGILARPSVEDRNCLDELDIPEIDIVLVNLYRFEEKLQQNLSEAQMVEQIDIGGVSLLRAAAKNFERVAVISDPKQYDRVLESVEANAGKITDGLRKQLAYEALARTASYDKSISNYLASQLKLNVESTVINDLPATITVQLEKVQDLRYGENPHQAAAWYGAVGGAVASDAKFPPYEQLQGKEMSANNITDAFALVRVLRELESPGVCIIKHNNPCGVAVADKIEQAYDIAYACDPISAFGGVYGFTEKVTAEIASKIAANFVEIVLAPEFDKEALNVFSKKKNVRILRMPKDALKPLQIGTLHIKDLADFGYLVEKDIEEPVKSSDFKCVTKKKVDASYARDLAFTWGVVKHLTSNAIFIARNGRSLGFGIGQTSRIASVNIALAQAGKDARGAVLASDAFFPATDNIESAAKAGIEVIIQPGGSVKDDDVIKACDDAGIAMLFTGQRCFRH